jgi:RNA polymerase sigma-70 factor (ECF subfamily)
MGQPEGTAERPDGELVRQALEGQSAAYGALVERYRREFARYAASLCGDADLAADAMQEAFISAYGALATCRDPDRFGAWFFRILTNQCHNRRDRRRPHLSLESVVIAGGEPADQRLSREELREAIERALDRLSPDLRETFVLREIEGRPYAEIATLMDVGEAALRKRVERAREIARSALEDWL